LNWIKIILNVKSSDLEEIRAAYKKALPYVVFDWAKMIVEKPRQQRAYLIDRIERLHGSEITQMVRDEITALRLASSQKTSSQQSLTSHSK